MAWTLGVVRMKKGLDMQMILEAKVGDITVEQANDFNDKFVEFVQQFGWVCGGGYKEIAMEEGDYESNKQVKSSRSDSEHRT